MFPTSAWDDWHVERELGVRAEALDVGGRILTLAGGRRLRYDRLLIATGARPRRLDVPGAELDGVLTLRSLPDATDLRDRLRASRRIVVVGAGLVGLEVASAARSLGVEVTVVEADHAPLRRVIGPQMGGTVAGVHAAGDVARVWRPERGGVGRRLETYANAAAQGAAAGGRWPARRLRTWRPGPPVGGNERRGSASAG